MNTYFVIAAAVVSLLMAFGLYRKNAAIKVADARMSEIAGYIHEGAMAYLKRQYMVMAAFAAVMFIFLALILNIQTALCFLLGALDKFSLFPAVRRDGVLPRKTFSMGHSREKRYYLEGRKIK